MAGPGPGSSARAGGAEATNQGGAGFPHSPVTATTDRGPMCRWPCSPYKSILYFLAGSKLGMVTSSWSEATGTSWGCPSLSLYRTTKESNWPSGTVHKRLTESGVTPVTVSSPRRGSRGVLVAGGVTSGCGAGTEMVGDCQKRAPFPSVVTMPAHLRAHGVILISNVCLFNISFTKSLLVSGEGVSPVTETLG